MIRNCSSTLAHPGHIGEVLLETTTLSSVPMRTVEVVGDQLDELVAREVVGGRGHDGAFEVRLERGTDLGAPPVEEHPLVGLGHAQGVTHLRRRPPVEVPQREHLPLRRRESFDGRRRRAPWSRRRAPATRAGAPSRAGTTPSAPASPASPGGRNRSAANVGSAPSSSAFDADENGMLRDSRTPAGPGDVHQDPVEPGLHRGSLLEPVDRLQAPPTRSPARPRRPGRRSPRTSEPSGAAHRGSGRASSRTRPRRPRAGRRPTPRRR